RTRTPRVLLRRATEPVFLMQAEGSHPPFAGCFLPTSVPSRPPGDVPAVSCDGRSAHDQPPGFCGNGFARCVINGTRQLTTAPVGRRLRSSLTRHSALANSDI